MLIKSTSTEDRYTIRRVDPDYQGKGTFIWANGSRYEGEFLDGRLQGSGVFYWPDGSSFRGEWIENLPHGKGIYIWPDGRQIEGEWDRGNTRLDPGRTSTRVEAPSAAKQGITSGTDAEMLKRLQDDLQLRLNEEEAGRKEAEEAKDRKSVV